MSEDPSSIVTISGRQATSKGCGVTSYVPNEKSTVIGADVSFKTIYFWAMNPSDVAHPFTSSEDRASSIILDVKTGALHLLKN